MKSDKRPIEIEDLLRLKKAERPPAEFWSQFDRELRAKQLAAIVARRPWWHGLSGVFGQVSRYRLPIGAAAALAITLVSFREYQGQGKGGATEPSAPAPRVASPDTPVIASASKSEVRETVAAVGTVAERSMVVTTAGDLPSRVAPEPAATASAAAILPARVSLLPDTVTEFASVEAPVNLRHMGAALTVVPASMEAPLTRGLLANAPTGFEARVMPARAVVEPLQQITPPGERTRAKLMTAMLSMTSVDAPSRTGERVAERLSEERLYDTVHRFSARGAGVGMKF
jgi:hypothetical protein